MNRTGGQMKTIIVVALAGALTAAAQNPLSADARSLYNTVKGEVLRSAEKMPEENYSFRPTPEVRSFGQLIGHVADAQYEFCSPVKGENRPSSVEKTAKTKAELIAGLKQAFAYCDPLYSSLTDATAAETVKFGGRDMTRLGVLTFNSFHAEEHYGNMVTYLRMKGLVPPSSERNSR
jgi:uncharacterized damage-inducible protein DinB